MSGLHDWLLAFAGKPTAPAVLDVGCGFGATVLGDLLQPAASQNACHAANGRTLCLSTHSLAVAEELCDRIGVLDRGKLVALGDLAELRERAAAMPSARELRDLNGSATLESVFLQLIQAIEGEW